MNLGTTALRTIIGLLFVGHGTQKLFGWFGGSGPEGTGGFFESIGLRPGRRHAIAAGTTEAASGALLAMGLLIPLAATGLSATMITAIRKVHGANGPWSTDNGYEYNLVLLGALVAITDHRHGPAVALGQLAAGAAGSYAATALAEREQEPLPEPEGETAQREARFTVEREPQPARA